MNWLSKFGSFLGIAPKVAIRFTAFEQFKGLLQNDKGQMTWQKNLLAGLGAGMVESILVVTPVELVKIRLQSQLQSGATAKYKGQIHGYIFRIFIFINQFFSSSTKSNI